jgi:hypothetical protein
MRFWLKLRQELPNRRAPALGQTPMAGSQLWASRSCPPGDEPLVFKPGGPGFVDHDGALGMKWPWVRLKEGKLVVGGRPLDANAPPARAYISDGYGLTGFQPTYLVFPTPGCWAITGAVSGSTLTFVLKVELVGEGPDWRWSQGDMPSPGWRVTSDWRE